MTLLLPRSMTSSDSPQKTPNSHYKDIDNYQLPIKSQRAQEEEEEEEEKEEEEEEESSKKICNDDQEKEVDQTTSSSEEAALLMKHLPAPNGIDTTAVGGGSSAAEESGRERLSRHRREIAGRVWIPDTWGQESLLKDWIDCNVFDASLVNNNILSARAALMQQRSTTAVPNNPTLLRGIENSDETSN